MDKGDIINVLLQNHNAFIAKIRSLSDMDFTTSNHGKWNAGQQLSHIVKSVVAVQRAFELPKSVLGDKFGTTNRKNRTYEEVVSDYLNTLNENPDYVLLEKFTPSTIAVTDKTVVLEQLHTLIKMLTNDIDKCSEMELNTFILPHPVMGNQTLREILYFTAYHVLHHDKQVLKNLKTN